ncbi:DNA alkylation repair protein [Hymenobacter jeollabukensis]|uniref:DNA alkylation repair protein n=1 Tax=Hymenobacter jeollabukensis TaxID=2025313 RepID=A0A5R8WQ89_9BACT|nr:DNA alkylation repair protein [Hymenobacter jeollabukensis]TLM91892.1 DNA alkylation repair protein [Hymenobacter jeollabukensis]
MTFDDLLAQLRALGSEQTRKTYLRHGFGDNTFGVSFAHFGALKKQLVGRGKDKNLAQQLARQLWQSGYYDARTLATMIADPQQFTPAEADAWAADVTNHSLADALAGLLAGTDFAWAKVAEWTQAAGEYPQRLGYALLSRLALQDSGAPDAAFVPYVTRIEQQLQTAPNRAKEGMNGALIAIGSRSEGLREQVESAADRIGPVVIDHGDTACQTPAIRPYLAKIWARKAVKA